MLANGPCIDIGVRCAARTMGGQNSPDSPLVHARTVGTHTGSIIMCFDAKKELNIRQQMVSTTTLGSRKASTEPRRRW